MANHSRVEGTNQQRRRYLKAVGGVVGATTITSLAGCTGGSDNGAGNGGTDTPTESTAESGDDNGYSETIDKAFMSPDSLKIDLWKAFLNGMKEAAEDFGLSASAQDHGGQLSKQISQIEGAITSGADMIAATAPSDSGVRSLAETAVDNGVPFFEYWSMGKWLVPSSVGPEFVQYQIPETFHAGAIPAKILFEEMGGSGNVVVILGPKGHIGSYRYEGFKQAAEEYPDINVLAHQYSGGWTRKKGREVMSAFVSNYGDDIDGVYCNNGTLGLGAASILSENDMAIPFTGFDGALSNIEYIRNNGPDSGEPYQVQEQAAPPFWQGGWAVAKAWDWLHGWRPKVPERMLWVRTLTVLNPELDQSKFSDLDTRFATPEKYMSVAYSDGHSPYDWKAMSVHESGDDWDPQHRIVPIRKSEWEQLKWTEDNKPSNLQIPDAYDDEALFNQVDEDYKQRNQNGKNPYL
ncbi:sugar ABC transporter substrate-binding protein [Haloferax sulfurifontis]|nr:sugar ABC transporter substrate-binding protein [Haloferax sulfurifontis]